MENLDQILEYIENEVHPKALIIFEDRTGDKFEEMIVEAFRVHKEKNIKIQTAMANIISKV